MVSDDIVTQLRAIVPIHEGRKGHGCIAKAADEIERLRKYLFMWGELADGLYEYSDHKPGCTDNPDECTCGYEEHMTGWVYYSKRYPYV